MHTLSFLLDSLSQQVKSPATQVPSHTAPFSIKSPEPDSSTTNCSRSQLLPKGSSPTRLSPTLASPLHLQLCSLQFLLKILPPFLRAFRVKFKFNSWSGSHSLSGFIACPSFTGKLPSPVQRLYGYTNTRAMSCMPRGLLIDWNPFSGKFSLSWLHS